MIGYAEERSITALGKATLRHFLVNRSISLSNGALCPADTRPTLVPAPAGLELPEPLRVAVSDSFLLSGAHWEPIKECTRLGHRAAGIVRGATAPRARLPR